jgi:hypothetical protein
MNEDLRRRLARRLEVVAARDAERIRQEREMAAVRREAAFELYVICSNLVRSVNAVSEGARLELSPPDYSPELFRDSGPNLFQISVSGRLVDIAFESTEAILSTESFRTPYTIQGAVRWFSQESLESLGVREHLLFCCVEEGKGSWVWLDSVSHRTGACDEDYLGGLIEELLK